MKVDIKDLMDCYFDDSVKLDDPKTFLESRPVAEANSSFHATSRNYGKRSLLVAAVLLLVVTAAVATPLVLSRTAGSNAMTGGVASTESAQNELPSALPTEVSATATPREEHLAGTPETIAESQTLIAPYAITGAKVRENYAGTYATYGDSLLRENNNLCYGNIINIDGMYYTLTDNGPELLETQNLNTTVELYGAWEVDIDYAIVDGSLVFHNNTSTESYAVIEGERISLSEYLMDHDRAATDEIDWITPNVAVASPLEGSADTVILRILRTDRPDMEGFDYTFLYNIITGEIKDPLANIPELYSHGRLSGLAFNGAVTRAIADVQGDDELLHVYICDLLTGEMNLLTDLLEHHLPELETDGVEWMEDASCCAWADDNTLLVQMIESVPNGIVEETTLTPEGDWIDPWDDHSWLFSYNVAEDTVNYQLQDTTTYCVEDMTHPYVHHFLDGDESCFQVLNTADGTLYTLEMAFDLFSWDETATRTVIYEDGKLYLIDDTQMCWTELSNYMEPPEEGWPDISTAIKLVTSEWVCLMTEDTVYCYHIPVDIPMTPLTVK